MADGMHAHFSFFRIFGGLTLFNVGLCGHLHYLYIIRGISGFKTTATAPSIFPTCLPLFLSFEPSLFRSGLK
ncbi:hypothetical protein DFH08DRAFT_832489 [Mycena albidolilacea]|uniref:Uncharacterized protein n=1 Tax=Mycena albidolilacea TaxID=1033008 RepID=A0AAD7AVP6_9AGAR|nr:hypothetical protein DFH08DRAFT_832489 [Mycena albidolilacea]